VLVITKNTNLMAQRALKPIVAGICRVRHVL